MDDSDRNRRNLAVREAEGYIRAVADIDDIWDAHAKAVTLLDNNILAMPKHFEMICQQLIKRDLAVDFNQGLDIRLVNKNVINWLNKIKLQGGVRFAFDSPELEPIIRRKVALLRKLRK